MATTISAAEVKKLRDQTGAGMMECKNALTEANGDFEEANTILRKRGLATAAKKAGRSANEGLIAHRVAADHSSGILAEVNCESDFVARTPDFVQLMERVLAEIETAGDAATEAWLKDPQGPVVALVAPVIAKLGENMAVSRTRPSAAGRWARKMPSKRPPRRSMAARERALRASVLSTSRCTRQVSKACASRCSALAVKTAVRCAAGASQAWPISATSGGSPASARRGSPATETGPSGQVHHSRFMNRIEPRTCPATI